MPRLELPLVGLLEDTLLVGEERAFAPPVIDASTLAVLAAAAPPRVCVLTIATAVELPSLVTGRWATECVVTAATPAELTLRGVRRVRVLAGRGRPGAYTADLEAVDATEAPPDDLAALLSGAHALLAALDAGAIPAPPDAPTRLRAVLYDLLRACATGEELRDAMREPPAEALRSLARTLAARAPWEHASCELEAQARALANKPEPSTALKHRLWAQLVEIQKRLDVYDPLAAAEAGDDVARLQRALSQAGLPRAARETAKRELRLLREKKAASNDHASYLSHLEFMARLPWHPETLPALDLRAVREALDREHAGLEVAKRRVREYLAVRALGGRAASTVLCLVGPPGVGKTSLARAIATALGRKFVRVPLGGVHDECEIRGHRLSFSAAAPGRVLGGLALAGSCAPVMLLDEIDKLGADRSRSPYAALLEVLDPEQNHQFQDNFLGVPYDLSHVLFVCTANDLAAVDPTLRDRMEPIELEGYTTREKLELTRSHLLPRLREDHGLPTLMAFDDAAMTLAVEGHTREAGVRQLTRVLGALHRARALAIVEDGLEGDAARAASARPCALDEVDRVLGPARYPARTIAAALPPGVATGLSIGPEGGAPLFVEVAALPGDGELRLTGRLGDVMRESAQAALAHLRADPRRYGVEAHALACDFHVHVPDGATPKDGPSAGAALAVAFLSAVTGRPVRADTAFTGEVTLSGRVLPVGGVRAKTLAAQRAGARCVVVPEGNRADVPTEVLAHAVFVDTVEDVVRAAFAHSPAANSLAPSEPEAGATDG